MWRWWTLTLLLAACRGADGPEESEVDASLPDAPPPRPDAAPHPGETWVMAWNIEEFPMTPETVTTVADILTQVNPDVVGVEEIVNAQAFRDLDEQLPGFVGLLADDPNADLRVGLLYQPDRVTVDG